MVVQAYRFQRISPSKFSINLTIFMNFVLTLFTALLLLKLLADLGLDWLNLSEVNKNANKVPEAFQHFVDSDTYSKSVAYSLTNMKFSMWSTIYDTALLAIIIFSGLLVFLWNYAQSILGTGIWGQAISLFAITIILSIPSFPFELYNTFKIEAKFGFNKSSLGLWITDKIKGIALSAVIAVPLFALILWIVKLPLWWVWATVVLAAFQIVMMVLYPVFIMPLFNKFTELEDGDLKDRLMSLADRTGFKAKSIYIMDGSKRSGHSNAFFSGLGKMRRIVLFDTLVEKHTEEELEAILAHEIGHYKLGHIPKMLLVNILMTAIGFYILGLLVESAAFVEAFGFTYSPEVLTPTFILFTLFSGLITFWMSPFSNIFSRRHEYQADAFSKKAMQGDAKPLIEALHKLHNSNLSNLTPHKLYSAFHYSHPTLMERETALKEG